MSEDRDTTTTIVLLYRSVRDAAIADVGRACAMAAGAALLFAPVEYGLTVWSYAGPISLAGKLRLAAVTVTLSLLLWWLLAVGLSAVLVASRWLGARVAAVSPRADRVPAPKLLAAAAAAAAVAVAMHAAAGWAIVQFKEPQLRAALIAALGLIAIAIASALYQVIVRVLAGSPAPMVTPGSSGGWFVASALDGRVRRGVPMVWAVVIAALATAALLQRVSVWAIARHPSLAAVVIAVAAVVGLVICALAIRWLTVAVSAGARVLAPTLGAINPLGRWRAAGLAFAQLIAVALVAAWFVLPQSRSVLPVRLVIAGIVVTYGMGLGALVNARPRRTRRRRIVALGLAIGSVAVVSTTLAVWGADPKTRGLAITASPAFEKLTGVVRTLNDLDRDGFGTLLGEPDCAPFDSAINPGATDTPDDGIDQNCSGRDFSLSAVVTPSGPTITVPPEFARPWNVLLITVDTLRYDRTTFGGYPTRPGGRDTTPHLAKLVSQATSFTFAQAPSAGTMASIPAILTSKFFHSGIAIDETVRPGSPPKLLPENTLIAEIMKRAGYRTGVIGSHVWWNDWGFDQGVDDYDNSIGKTDDAYRVAADKVTNHALAWISRQQGEKWFLWAHYIDPHGRYVAHPEVVDYGTTEPDLYDAEVRWTDQELGRLFDELVRLPSTKDTIIVITSDHGDSMGEHNVPLGTHGTALYREMLHVPLIFYIPENRPQQIGGAVTPLDIVPTIAELCGIDVSDLSFEGRSLVPELFTGRADLERIVFAETNAPGKQRAAISAHWKLIHYLTTNLDELFDLAADPWEKTNLASRRPPAYATMKQALQDWMDRVLYARDPVFNQAFRQMSDVLSKEAPAVATSGQLLLDGAIEVVGIGPAARKPLAPGAKTDIHVYFRVHRPPKLGCRFQLAIWQPSAPNTVIRSAMRATADGAYSTERWKEGDQIRERFAVTIPSAWRGPITVGMLTSQWQSSEKIRPTGAAAPADPFVAMLGTLMLQEAPAK
ncbi:MAG: sulfatase-like hydrolase/transferase [Kofleriaceae bacterium]